MKAACAIPDPSRSRRKLIDVGASVITWPAVASWTGGRDPVGGSEQDATDLMCGGVVVQLDSSMTEPLRFTAHANRLERDTERFSISTSGLVLSTIGSAVHASRSGCASPFDDGELRQRCRSATVLRRAIPRSSRPITMSDQPSTRW